MHNKYIVGASKPLDSLNPSFFNSWIRSCVVLNCIYHQHSPDGNHYYRIHDSLGVSPVPRLRHNKKELTYDQDEYFG